MTRDRSPIATVSAALATALLVASCGGEGVQEPAPLREAPPETTLEAPLDGPAVRLPENFPKDLPVFPHVERTLGTKSDGRAMGAMFESSSSPAEVFEYYKTKLVEEGWEIRGQIDQGDQRALNVSKGDEVATVLINRQDEKTQITLLTGRDPAAVR